MLISFTIFDSIYSNSKPSVGYLSEVMEEETCKGIVMGMKVWQDLEMRPKLQALECHLLIVIIQRP
jgi:hypothetical protein